MAHHFASTGFSGLSTMTEEAKYQFASLASIIFLVVAYFIACSYHNNESIHDKPTAPKIASPVVKAAIVASSPTNNINNDINKEGNEMKEETIAADPPKSPEQKAEESAKVAYAKFPATKVDITQFLVEMRKGLPVNYVTKSNKIEKKNLRLSNDGELYWSKDKVVLNSIKKAFTPKGKSLDGHNPCTDLVSVFADNSDSEWFIVEFKATILKMQVRDITRNAEVITSLTVLAHKIKADSTFATNVDAKLEKSKIIASPAATPTSDSATATPAPAASAATTTPGAEQNVWRDVASTAKP